MPVLFYADPVDDPGLVVLTPAGLQGIQLTHKAKAELLDHGSLMVDDDGAKQVFSPGGWIRLVGMMTIDRRHEYVEPSVVVVPRKPELVK